MALLARLAQISRTQSPLVLSANYIDRVDFGPAEIDFKDSNNKSTSSANVSLRQKGILGTQ